MAKKSFFLLLCCSCALYVAFPVAQAVANTKAAIENIAVTTKTKNVEVSFRVTNCFTPKMEEAIESGVPTTFRIHVVLEKPGIPYLRTQLLNVVLEHTIKYDRLKNEYLLDLPEHLGYQQTTEDFEEAKQWMSVVQDLPLLPLWRLKKEETYQVRLKAELSKVHLPLFFRYIFFFVSLWDFETDWQKISFSP